MNERTKTNFLRQRMIQLREKNGYSLSQFAAEFPTNKSTLSRVEKIDGETNHKTVKEWAEKYCEKLQMSEQQIQLFMRGEKAVIVDTKALITRPDLLGELREEYSYVVVPSFVIDELKSIKNNNPNDYGLRALDLLNKIQRYDIKSYPVPDMSEQSIIEMANALSEELSNEVDIITADDAFALNIKGTIKEDSKYSILFLEEYAATKQKLINMRWLNAVNEYYSDFYDDIEVKLAIKMPTKNEDDWNYYLANGTTLIISAVKNDSVPVKQRIEKIRWLINNGADVNKRDHESKNFPAITHAIKMHNYEIFTFLLNECNANPNIGSRNPYDIGKIRQKNDGNMPLMVAAWENQIEMVKDLCADKRVSLNQQDGNGFTALIKACYWGNTECRKIIESSGADTTILDHEGFSAEDRWDECIRIGRYKEKEHGN